MIRDLMNRYATPLTLGFGLVTAVTGVFLFFHFQQRLFEDMHVWIGLALLVPLVLHVVRNRRAFGTYFRRGTVYVPVAASIFLAALFVVPQLTGSEGEANPRATIAGLSSALGSARIADVAPVFGYTPDGLVARLRAEGIAADSPEETIAAVAGRSARPVFQVVALLPQPAPQAEASPADR